MYRLPECGLIRFKDLLQGFEIHIGSRALYVHAKQIYGDVSCCGINYPFLRKDSYSLLAGRNCNGRGALFVPRRSLRAAWLVALSLRQLHFSRFYTSPAVSHSRYAAVARWRVMTSLFSNRVLCNHRAFRHWRDERYPPTSDDFARSLSRRCLLEGVGTYRLNNHFTA